MVTGSSLEGLQSASATVIALHCSGAGGAMWRPLQDRLVDSVRLLTPDLYGAAAGPVWSGEHAFSLDDEAAPIIRLIDDAHMRVHLVGHSYGASVALHAALARPRRIAGLTLYEPTAFHLLRAADGIEYAEITGLAHDIGTLLAGGDARGAMKRFVTYWGGAGSWDALSFEAQAALMRWAPKAPLDFHALLGQRTQLSQYERLDMPCQIIAGERSPDPVREIAQILSRSIPNCALKIMDGIGHMGPVTQGGQVAALIADHVRSLVPIQLESGRAA